LVRKESRNLVTNSETSEAALTALAPDGVAASTSCGHYLRRGRQQGRRKRPLPGRQSATPDRQCPDAPSAELVTSNCAAWCGSNNEQAWRPGATHCERSVAPVILASHTIIGDARDDMGQPHRSRTVAQIVTPADRRCQFVPRSGPPAGAPKSHSPGLLPALHRSTMGTTTGTSGTVRARLSSTCRRTTRRPIAC
jgi:hypothetical protein